MQKILVAGSIAFDYLFSFDGVFQDQLAISRAGSLSVAFNVGNKAVHFGGCAGNIAYNGKLLGDDFVMLGICGKDFNEYETWLKKNKISTEFVLREPTEYTSQAMVVSDKKGQQLTFFYEGAAAKSKNRRSEIHGIIQRLSKDLSLALISPNNREFMLACLSACREFRIPYIFDPGQAMPMFKPHELLEIINAASGVILNEYELSLLLKLLDMKKQEILDLTPLLIITLGERGSEIYFSEKILKIPAKKPRFLRDPTGAGDAYRGGFLAGIQNHFPKLTPEILEKAGMLGAKLATACIESVGTQNHKI